MSCAWQKGGGTTPHLESSSPRAGNWETGEGNDEEEEKREREEEEVDEDEVEVDEGRRCER